MNNLPSVAQLLVQGGDERIWVNEDTGVNKYGVSPRPYSNQVEFSSSTASHMSPEAWFAVEKFRARINDDLIEGNDTNVWRLEEQRIRKEFIDCWGLGSAGISWYLHRSGTDAHAMAAGLAYRRFGRPFRVVTGEFAETGSKIPNALLNGVRGHATIAMEIKEILIRNLDGSPRSAKAIDQDFYRAVVEANADDVPVLLIRVDESKTGCVYPSLELVNLLAARSPENVAVLVDCSQLRCSEQRLKEYIHAHYMVALTGSKYFGASAFCGALLADEQWRRVWPGQAIDLDEYGNLNFGLLARWEAAIFTMKRHQLISEQNRNEVLAHFQAAVLSALLEVETVELLAVTRDAETGPRSLYALRGLHRFPRRNLMEHEVENVYRNLLSTKRRNGNTYILGQPVPCGGRWFQRTQSVRLSLSAQLLINVCQMPDHEGLRWLQAEVLSAVRALDMEIQLLP